MIGANMNSQVQVLAHRGLVSETAPENSLKAFADALALGADVIETDVQCSKDGVAIIFHDDDLKRLCGLDAKVSKMNWQDLKNVELGSQEKIPSLEQVLLAFPNAKFNLDIKSNGAIHSTALVINKLDVNNRVLISSFSESRRKKTLSAVNGKTATSAGVSRVLAIYFSVIFRLSFLTKILTKDLTALQLPPSKGIINFHSPLFINTIKRFGVQLHFWTINSPEEMLMLVRDGADGIVTDHCDLAIQTLR
jgi:glycerophosphoryl diester phosphodiesterase